MNTTENNKLIAEFMEFQQTNIGWYDAEEVLLRTEKDNTFDDLKFHTDWNWLMEVVEKIEGLKTPITNNPNLLGKFVDYEFHIQDKHIKIYAHGEVTKEVVDFNSSESETKIKAVYNACVEFIKWYNENSR